MPPVQFVVYLPTELPGGLRIYTPRMDIRQERMVVQRHHLDAFHHLLYRVGHGVVGTGAEQGSRARLHLYEPKDSLTLDVRRNSIASSMILPPSDNPKSYHSFSRSLTLKEGVSSFLNGDRYQYCPPRTLTGSWPSSRR